MSIPDFEKLPDIPRDEDGPVFNAPWQAQAFALAVNLQEQGIFSWDEWAQQMSVSISEARKNGDPDLGNTYYDHWLLTLEAITMNKGICDSENLVQRKKQVEDEHNKLHGHGHSHSH